MFKFTNLPWAQVSCHNRKLTLPTGYSVEGVVLDFSRGGGRNNRNMAKCAEILYPRPRIYKVYINQICTQISTLSYFRH